MEAIVINRSLSDNEEEVVLELLKSKQIELFTNCKISDNLSKFSKGKLEISPEEKKKLNSNIFDYIINFGEKLINGIAITDHLMLENASIWHYHKFRTYFVISNLYYEIKTIEDLAQKYSKVTVYSDKTLLQYYFNTENINLVFLDKAHKKINYISVFNYALFFKLRILIAFLQLSKVKKKKHILIDHTIKQNCLNQQTLRPELGNYNLQYLFDKMDDEFLILDEVEVPKFDQPNSFKLHPYYFRVYKNRLNSEFVLFWGFLSKKVRKKVKEQSDELQNKYKLIQSELSDPLDMLILNFLISLHASSKFYLLKYFSFLKIFKKYSFETISSIDENSPRTKSILDAAKLKNIYTFGIQHGIIHNLQPNYHFTSEDKTRNITADRTLIWGKYWENKLYNQANYPKDSLKTTGFIRTDIIPRLILDNDQKLFGITETEQMIVFASQPIKDAEMRRQVAFDVFSGLKNIENTRLVVKLHPAEMKDIEYYQNIANEAGYIDVIINGTTDLYLLISKAAMVITSFSTVGLESVFFNKPLITIDPLKQDIQGYHEDKIAFQASNSEELTKSVRGILNGSLTFDKDIYNIYLASQVYKIDGKVSERCIEIIKSHNKPIE